jgi:hypothetical protein
MKPKEDELRSLLTEVKKVVNKWLHLDDRTIIDVIMATYIANRFNSDPCWVNVIGAPSHSKTELLRAFDGHKNTYLLSNLTPSTLVSGKDTKKGDPSLLPKLTDKFVVLKDFTTVLAMRSENQSEIIAQLREIYDGKYSKVFGTGKEFQWSGRVGLIAACTPAYDKHHAVTGSLGERFLLYRTGGGNNIEMGLQAQRIVGHEDEMRAEIRKAVHNFIDKFESVKHAKLKPNEEINNMIVALACVVALGRCPVERDRGDKCVLYDPEPEGTPRLVKQLMQIGMGIAVAHEKKQFDEEIYKIIKKIARDQLPVQRLKALKYLWDEKATDFLMGWRKTKEVADAIKKPSYTTLLLLEDLMIVGCLNRTQEGDGQSSPYMWQLTNDFSKLIGQSEFFENEK